MSPLGRMMFRSSVLARGSSSSLKSAFAVRSMATEDHFEHNNLAPLESSRTEVTLAGPSALKPKPPIDRLLFGKFFTDHLLRVHWSAADGWDSPKIVPFHNLSLHPGAKVLHYAQELFEGMKAYRGVDDKIRLFRPMHNMARMNLSAIRACLPTFDGKELVECIRKLVQIDQEWVPHHNSSSLYIRPTLIGTEPALGVSASNEAELYVVLCPVGPYFSTGAKAVRLFADPKYVRAWPGGCGFAKMGSNYAPTLWIGKLAAQHGCQQVLWLFGESHEITEVGAMNLFIFLEHANGRRELVTPPLDMGMILAGVTRRSIIEMVAKWGEFEVNERPITMPEVVKANAEGRLLEVFGAGTAAVVSPVGGIFYEGKMHDLPVPENSLSSRILASMSDIFYGRVASDWSVDIETWNINPNQEMVDYLSTEGTLQRATA